VDPDLRNDILMVLLARVPNWVSEQTVRSRVGHAAAADVDAVLAELCTAGHLEREADPGGDPYYRLTRRDGLPIRRTIRVGDSEIPRLLADSSPRFLPEHFNDAVEQLAELSTTLEQRFRRVVAEEQRRYWANIVGIFSVLVSVLALILTGLPKILSDPALPFWSAVLVNLSQLLPLAVALILLVLVLRWVVR